MNDTPYPVREEDFQEALWNCTALFPKGTPAGEDGPIIDMVLLNVGVSLARAEEIRPLVTAWLRAYPDQNQLRQGPSYIHVGAVIGSQEAAFRLFAVVDALGLGKVLTPARLGIEGKPAEELAGRGFVYLTDYTG